MRAGQRSSQQKTVASQLDLFSVTSTALGRDDSAAQVAQPTLAIVASGDRSAKIASPVVLDRRAMSDIRVISVEDMPGYAELEHEIVERSLMTLPEDRIWFTYSAVQRCFGISRATIARRMKDGLIPGIRFQGANVLEDGPVRRFDRTQLRWLLLAARAPRAQHFEHSRKNLRQGTKKRLGARLPTFVGVDAQAPASLR